MGTQIVRAGKLSTSHKRTNVQMDKQGSERACTVATLLECASEGKSEDYLSTQRQATVLIDGPSTKVPLFTLMPVSNT